MDKKNWIKHKIIHCDAIAAYSNMLRATNNKIVFTNGCFDILHHGHLSYLAAAASLGNKLIVGINSDASVKRLKGNDRPLTHEQDRLFQVSSLLVVDAVCLFEEDTPLALIESVKPDVLAKGGDYTAATIVGADFVKSYNGELSIIPFVTGYSTTHTIERIKHL